MRTIMLLLINWEKRPKPPRVAPTLQVNLLCIIDSAKSHRGLASRC
jgi:hypothetical protein